MVASRFGIMYTSSVGSIAVNSGVFGKSGSEASRHVKCSGHETHILECNSTLNSQVCPSTHEAGVVCQGEFIIVLKS